MVLPEKQENRHDDVSKPKGQERMARLGTSVRKSTMDSFKHYVQSKHGKISGAIGPEVDAALQAYLEKNKRVAIDRKNTILGNPKGIRRDRLERFQAIASELQTTDGFPIVNLKTIQKIIGYVLGKAGRTDLRTFNIYQKGVVQYCTEKPSTTGSGYFYDVSKFISKVQGLN